MRSSILLGLTLFTQIALAVQVVDDLGRTVTLDHPAERIISLAPDVTENLFAIGAQDKIVGVIRGSDFPRQSLKLPIVGSYSGIDVEKILSLRPDLIVSWGNNFYRSIARLRKFGIPVYITQPNNLMDIPRTLKHLAELTHMQPQASEAAQDYESQLMRLIHRYHDKEKIPVYYQIGTQAHYTINKTSWINQAITFCGGENVFANIMLQNAQVSLEAIIKAKPEVIITSTGDENWRKSWAFWQMIPAVAHHHLYTIDPDIISRAGPRLTLGVAAVCSAIQKARLNRL